MSPSRNIEHGALERAGTDIHASTEPYIDTASTFLQAAADPDPDGLINYALAQVLTVVHNFATEDLQTKRDQLEEIRAGLNQADTNWQTAEETNTVAEI